MKSNRTSSFPASNVSPTNVIRALTSMSLVVFGMTVFTISQTGGHLVWFMTLLLTIQVSLLITGIVWKRRVDKENNSTAGT